jgi:hypothetical protein
MGWMAAGSVAMIGASAIMQKQAADEAKQAMKTASAEHQRALQEAITQLENNWKVPEYDRTPLTPQQYEILAKYTPTIAQYTEEKAPQMLTGKGAQESIAVQKDALRKLQAQSNGVDEQDLAQREMATTQAQNRLTGQRANILRDMAARGLSGSGQELMANISAANSQEEMARQEGLQAAAAGSQRRSAALRDMMGLAGQMRTSSENQERSNVDVMNAFNQRAAMNKNSYDKYKAQEQQAANYANQQNMQNVGNQNVGLANDYAKYNQGRADRIESDVTSNNNDKLRNILAAKTGASANASESAMGMAKMGGQAQGAIAGTVGQIGTVGLSSALTQTPEKPETAPQPKELTPEQVEERNRRNAWRTQS